MNIVIRRSAVFLILYVFVISGSLIITHSPKYVHHAVLSLGTLADLTVLPMFLFYLIVGRDLRLSFFKTTLVYAAIARIAFWVLPVSSNIPEFSLTAVIVFLEGITFVAVAYRSRLIFIHYHTFRESRNAESALADSLTKVLGEIFGRIFMTEIRVLTYGLFGLFLKTDIVHPQKVLTSFKKSEIAAILAAMIVVGLIETIATHFLIGQWSQMTAFWITALSLYGILFIAAELFAVYKRPSYITSEFFHLRLGIRWHATIPLSLIDKIETISKKQPRTAGLLNGSLVSVPNTLIKLKSPVIIFGPYALRREITCVTVFLDNADDISDI